MRIILYFVFCNKYSFAYNFYSHSAATTPITEDLVLTTAPTITSTVSTVTSTSSSTEITTESSDQSTEYEDESKVLFKSYKLFLS